MGRTTFDFSGQVVVITGGARGIGRGAAEAFAAAHARVYVVDLDHTAGEAAARGICDAGGRGRFVACDVTDGARVRSAFERIVGEAGRLDVLVNCAGGFWKQLSVEDTPEEEWDRIVDLNIGSVAGKDSALGRIAEVSDIVGSILFLDSPEAAT